MRVLEGSEAIASAVRLARPQVVAAYPITPQTHIVESLAASIANGEMDAEFLTAESEHSAASMVLGAAAAGVRTFTATSSQGLLYMSEVVFNIAGLRLPVVMTVANRAVGAPLSIWNDHQDSMSLRDAGWIQMFAQTAQEAHDLQLLAFRVAEDARVMLPFMLCVDGYVLTHAYEPVDEITDAQARALVPAYVPAFALDPSDPHTFGAYAEPHVYTEARAGMNAALGAAPVVIDEALGDLARATGRRYAWAFDDYRLDDAKVALVVMGTAAQTARVVVDALRARGREVGLLAPRTFRPFPAAEIADALSGAERVVVFDRSVSLGAGGILAGEVRAALYGRARAPHVAGVIGGLGGRDMSLATIERAVDATEDGWIDAKAEVIAS